MKKIGKKFVAYIRVSTKEQGISGLGLGEQRQAINEAVIKLGGTIESYYSDVASGKDNKRPELLRAIEDCKENGHTLIVAKLDRLGRNAAYLFSIRDNVKSLYIVDKPDIDTMQFGIYATMAQWECETISQRTKAALRERERKTGKRNGQKKGYKMDAARKAAVQSRRDKAMLSNNNQVAKNVIEMELEKGMSYRKIAEYLNKIGLRTPKDKSFSVASVQKIMKMYGLKKVVGTPGR